MVTVRNLSSTNYVRIVERTLIPSEAVMLFGLPDVGLVGVIAASHMISELELEEVAYMDTDLLPPMIVLHKGTPHMPLRIFGNEKILLAVSEVALPADAIHRIMRFLVEWGKQKNVKIMIPMGGVPTPNRQELVEPKVFAVASTPQLVGWLEGKNEWQGRKLDKPFEILREGYMVGPYALVLQYCMQQNIPAVSLLAQAFYNYPDPQAAAMVLKELSRVIEIGIDISQLLEKGEEIRLKARDIMKRTERELTKMRKAQEYDIPLYV